MMAERTEGEGGCPNWAQAHKSWARCWPGVVDRDSDTNCSRASGMWGDGSVRRMLEVCKSW